MTNTTPTAAARGWTLYQSTEPPLSLDDINRVLALERLNPIAPRTYDHYRRLARHGYAEYMPINELDVAVKLRRMRDAS